MQKIDKKISTNLSVTLSVIGIAGFFMVFFMFDLFDKQIESNDFLPSMLGLSFIGLGFFSFGALASYRRGIQYFIYFMLIILMAWGIGYIRHG